MGHVRLPVAGVAVSGLLGLLAGWLVTVRDEKREQYWRLAGE